MIDWITAHVLLDHSPIPTGKVLSMDFDGVLEWQSDKHLPVEGSYSSKIMLKTVSTEKGIGLRIHGNPLKFLQGHNLFGSDNPFDLLYGVYFKIQRLYPNLKLPPLPPNTPLYFTRLDITKMVRYEQAQYVSQVLFHLSKTARSRSSSGQFSGETLYFQKQSTRWSLKFYDKFKEIQKHSFHPELPNQSELEEFAKNTLRIELTLRTPEIDKLSLQCLLNPIEIFDEYYKRLTMSKNTKIPNKKLLDLKPSIQAVYYNWLHGLDVKSSMSSSTFYRCRKELHNKFNIDISIPNPDPDDTEPTVFSIPDPIEIPSDFVPQFARGTVLNYQPEVSKQSLDLA